jgi:hypothetical protein
MGTRITFSGDVRIKITIRLQCQVFSDHDDLTYRNEGLRSCPTVARGSPGTGLLIRIMDSNAPSYLSRRTDDDDLIGFGYRSWLCERSPAIGAELAIAGRQWKRARRRQRCSERVNGGPGLGSHGHGGGERREPATVRDRALVPIHVGGVHATGRIRPGVHTVELP